MMLPIEQTRDMEQQHKNSGCNNPVQCSSVNLATMAATLSLDQTLPCWYQQHTDASDAAITTTTTTRDHQTAMSGCAASSSITPAMLPCPAPCRVNRSAPPSSSYYAHAWCMPA